MKNIRIASIQFEPAPGDKAANLEKMRGFVESAARQGAAIAVFPEACISGYRHAWKLSHEALLELAEPVFDGPSSQTLLNWSRQYDMTIGAGLFEKTGDGKLYNTYVVAMPDGMCKRHRKIHAFERRDISSGCEYTVFDTPHGCRVGVLICFDNNIIENVRATALLGAEILLAPHQTGGCKSASPHAMGVIERSVWDQRHENPEGVTAEFSGPKGRGWLMRWLPARAHDNGLFLIFSNGVGVDDDEIRTGNAMILDPYGRIIIETCKAGDEMVIADLDAGLLPQSSGRRWLKARRPELYGPLAVSTGKEQDPYTVHHGEETTDHRRDAKDAE